MFYNSWPFSFQLNQTFKTVKEVITYHQDHPMLLACNEHETVLLREVAVRGGMDDRLTESSKSGSIE